MKNTVGKLLEKVVARRLAIQLEEDNLLPSTLGSYRTGKDTWANAAVLASDGEPDYGNVLNRTHIHIVFDCLHSGIGINAKKEEA